MNEMQLLHSKIITFTDRVCTEQACCLKLTERFGRYLVKLQCELREKHDTESSEQYVIHEVIMRMIKISKVVSLKKLVALDALKLTYVSCISYLYQVLWLVHFTLIKRKFKIIYVYHNFVL